MGNGFIFNIQRYSVHDGPGIRTTVFLKGCPLGCLWCHNPESLSFKPILTVHEGRCISCGACAARCHSGGPETPGSTECRSCGACAEACPTGARVMSGQSMTVSEVMAAIIRDRIFYDQSGGGVTFSGGEPTAQPRFLEELLAECRREGISAAIDTCGYTEKTTLIDLANGADLILYDLKGYDDARHHSQTGVPAAPILDNLDTLAKIHHSIWLRLPVVPGYTDDSGEMELLASRYSSLKSIKRVNLLPYHPMGEAKLKKIGKNSKLPNLSAPSSPILDMLAEIWLRHGFDTHIGA